MKKIIFLALIALLVVPLFALGCAPADAKNSSPTTIPPLNHGEEARIIEIILDEFQTNKNIIHNIELVKPQSLIVRLDSNPSTGYGWGEAEISNADIVAQASRDFVEPNANVVGASGTDVWVFDSLKAGTATIKMSYSRPWEGGEKDEFTVTINVTVK